MDLIIEGGERMNKREIRCDNDVVFKYLLVKQNELIRLLIYGFTGIHCKELYVTNPNILPEKSDEKTAILDILVTDENSNFFDIEMQNTPLTTSLIHRAQHYASRVLSSQMKRGKEYLLHPVYCIILVNRGEKFDCLFKEFVIGNKKGTMPHNLIHVIFVFLPYINQLKEDVGLSQLNTTERIIYALHNNLSSDILELGDEVILEMEQNKRKFTLDNGDWLTTEERIWWNNYLIENDKRELKEEIEEKEKALLEKDSIITQKDKVITQKDKVITQKDEEHAKIINTHLESVMKELHLSYDEAVLFLNGKLSIAKQF